MPPAAHPPVPEWYTGLTTLTADINPRAIATSAPAKMPDKFIIEAWTCLALSLCFVSLRFYARITRLGWSKLALDDFFMVLASLTYTAETTAAYFVGAKWLGLANSGMTAAQRRTLTPDNPEWRLRVNGSKTHVVGWYTYTTLMWLLKGCWIVYYSRLTDGVHKMHLRVQIGYVAVIGSYIIAIMIVTLKCVPFHKQWQIYPDPGNNCQPGYSKLQVSTIMAFNTATDLYLMAIPLPMIYKSQLPLRKKITLLVMFSGGFLVMIFGILRCVTLLTVGATNPAESGKWSVRESFVAMLVSNFPMVFPLFQNLYRRARGQSAKDSSAERSYPLNSNPGGKTTGRSKRSKYPHPLTMPNETAWGSDEAIVTNAGPTAQQTKSNGSTESMDTMEVTRGGTRTRIEVGPKSRKKFGIGIGGGGAAAAAVGGRESTSPPEHDLGQITVVQEYTVQESDADAKSPSSYVHFK